MSIWNQLSLQDSNSSLMENMIMFYDYVMMVILMILMMIMYLFFFMMWNKFIDRSIVENQSVEFVWTLLPMVFLIFLAIPSLKILYLMDEIKNPIISVKVIGHQWYWTYEYSEFNLEFDSFMLKNLIDNFRVLDVDNRLVLPYNNKIRLMISSLDVIHSFALPSMSLKIDAMPGRLNQIMFEIYRPGLFYGQCSEICGVNHSFMPIVIESTNLYQFLNWINNSL